NNLLKAPSGALNRGCPVLRPMGDSYEQPADHRPWLVRRPDWAGPGQRQDPSDQPAVPPARELGPPPGWAGRGPSQDPAWLPKLSAVPHCGALACPAKVPSPSPPTGLAARGAPREPRPADWLASGPYERHPALPGPPAYPVPGQPPYPVPGKPPPRWCARERVCP